MALAPTPTPTEVAATPRRTPKAPTAWPPVTTLSHAKNVMAPIRAIATQTCCQVQLFIDPPVVLVRLRSSGNPRDSARQERRLACTGFRPRSQGTANTPDHLPP